MPPIATAARRTAAVLLAIVVLPAAQAAEFRLDDGTSIVLNTNIVAGASWRISRRADDLIGKSNLDPDLCTYFQSCQGLFREQTRPAEVLRDAPGMPSVNFDDGNLNYDRGDIVQAPFRVNQDVNIQRGRFGFFARWLWFYDFENNSFTEYSPNRITPDNVGEVGVSEGTAANRFLGQVYGPGGEVRARRRDGRTLSQIGTDFQLLDFNFYGELPFVGDRKLEFRVGRQTVNWGESTVLVVNSINQANPANVNNLFRTGFTLDEVFTPVGMAFVSTNLSENLSAEVYYQYEWAPVEIPPAGSFYSFMDLGTPDIAASVNASFGGTAEDPEAVGWPLNNPLALITPTTATIPRLKDKEARHQGQYGAALKWFLPDLNYGTEFGFYFLNYHSKLPYASFHSTDASCARAGGNAQGRDARNTLEFLSLCPNLLAGQASVPLLADATAMLLNRPDALADFGVLGSLPDALPALLNLLTFDPNAPISDAVGFDTARIQLEYPEDRKMFGFSFNTPFGADYSLQGEVSYRPDLPLQVSVADLAFAAFGPSLTACHRQELNCNGTTAGVGFDENGDRVIYTDNDFVDADGNNPYRDTVNLIVGAAPGSARSFPNFVIPWRGGEIGENAPNSYIRGWEPFRVMQYNLGATRVYGASEAPASVLGADQIIVAYEVGGTHVLNFPDFDQLQIEGPLSGTTHASAGADGSGADGSRLACSTNPTCSIGPDGLRFNPYQASRDQFAHRFAWGYRIVSIIRWESVLPGLTVEPTLIWGHDIKGNSPGPGANFIEGRKTLNATVQFRYRTAFSFNVAWQMFSGGGANHVQRDRDNLGFFFRYQF